MHGTFETGGFALRRCQFGVARRNQSITGFRIAQPGEYGFPIAREGEAFFRCSAVDLGLNTTEVQQWGQQARASRTDHGIAVEQTAKVEGQQSQSGGQRHMREALRGRCGKIGISGAQRGGGGQHVGPIGKQVARQGGWRRRACGQGCWLSQQGKHALSRCPGQCR